MYVYLLSTEKVYSGVEMVPHGGSKYRDRTYTFAWVSCFSTIYLLRVIVAILTDLHRVADPGLLVISGSVAWKSLDPDLV